MARRILMTGRNAQYIEHRGANATPDHDREILMAGEEAVYEEYAYGQAAQSLTTGEECVTPGEDATDGEALVERLRPIFYNNDADVRLFLKEIAGMSPNDITDLVNRWVQDKRISDYGYSRKGTLWSILNDAGLYSKSRQNWNRRVF